MLRGKLLIWVLGAFLLAVAVRLPLLGQPIMGEEGIFLAISKLGALGYEFTPKTPAGMCDGQVIRTFPSHPGTPYFLFHLFGRAISAARVPSLHYPVFLRALILSLFAGGIAIASGLAVFSQYDGGKLRWGKLLVPFLVFFALFSTPLMVGASLHLQQDGTFGAIPYCIMLGILYLRRWGLTEKVLLFFGSYLIAFDKPERLLVWLAVRLIAEGLTGSIYFRTGEMKSRRARLSYEAAGVAFGILTIVLLDQRGWTDSLLLAFSMTAGAVRTSVSDYLRFLLKFIDPVYALILVFGSILALKAIFLDQRRENPGLAQFCSASLTGLGFGMAIWLASLSARWIGDEFPRYLVPGISVASITIIRAHQFLRNRMALVAAVSLSVLLIYHSTEALLGLRAKSVTSLFGQTFRKCELNLPSSGHCLAVIPEHCMGAVDHKNWIGAGWSQENFCALPVCKD